MGWFKHRRDFDADDEGQEIRFHELARYNQQVSYGLMHTPEQKARMALVQQEYFDHFPEDHVTPGSK